MNLRQFLLALRARFRVFALSLVAVVLAAAVASLVMPKSYRATVSLLVDSRSEQSMGEGLRELGMPQEHLSYLQTQADILASPKVARRVVEQLKLAELLLPMQQLRPQLLDEGVVPDLWKPLGMLRELLRLRRLVGAQLALRILETPTQTLQLLIEPGGGFAVGGHAQLQRRADIGRGKAVGDRRSEPRVA